MLKRFLHGLAFGAGFTLAAVVVVSLYSWLLPLWIMSWQRGSERAPVAAVADVDVAPLISAAPRFLGSVASYSGDFPSERTHPTLAAGPGTIVGKVMSNDRPVEGVRLRLALNGSALSGWATTDAQGAYVVDVPFGRYRVDGYMLDMEAANRTLAGKTDRPVPGSRFGSREFDVSQDEPGEGPTLAYVDPVVILGPSATVSLRDGVVVRWAPYPSAESYRIQLYEMQNADDLRNSSVFSWRERPTVAGTSFDLVANGVTLKNGFYYFIEIEARDAGGRALSVSDRGWQAAQFRVAE